MASDASQVTLAVASTAAAKQVKDALKARKWLSEAHRPATRADGVAFPISAGSEAAVRAAAADDGPLAGLLSSIELSEPDALAAKPVKPPQKPPQAAALTAPARPRVSQERSFGGGARAAAASSLPPAAAVRRLACPPDADAAWLREHAFGAREPVVLCGLALGRCVEGGWTPERLAAARGSAPAVSVHVCAEPSVDLAGHRAPNTPRNFVFRSLPFDEAVRRCAGGADPAALPPLLAEGERYYLRSVGLDPRKDAADFPRLFPELAAECRLLPGAAGGAPLLDGAAYHSSVLRLASDDTQLWSHFDVMDNALAQCTGRKRVVLWPPECDADLYVEGSSSRVANIDDWNDDAFPRYRRTVAHRREAILEPGDTLYIPALWFHNVTSIGFSVAVNVFWKSHAAAGLHDAKDLYGNRDPPAASKALDHAAAAAAQLAALPEPFRSFYARRAARELLEAAGVSYSSSGS